MLATLTSTMIQIPWFSHFSACWSSYTCMVYDADQTTLVTPSLTKSSTSSSSSASTRSESNMVKRRSKRSHCSSRRANQLVKQVSPFEELPVGDERYPFDEDVIRDDERHDIIPDRRVGYDTRDIIRRDDVADGGIPKYIFVPTKHAISDDESEVTLDAALFEEERALTPHPSFEELDNQLSAFDFHHLYNVSLQVDEQDWPSDEDGPKGNASEYTFWAKGSTHRRNLGHDVMMIMKDVDDGLSKAQNKTSKYRLV